MRKWK